MHTAGLDGHQDGRAARGVAAARVRARRAHARRHAGFFSHISFLLPTTGIFGDYMFFSAVLSSTTQRAKSRKYICICSVKLKKTFLIVAYSCNRNIFIKL